MQPASTFHAASIIEGWRLAASAVASPAGANYITVVTCGNGWNSSPTSIRALDDAARKVNAERPSSVANMLLPRVVQLSTENPAAAIEAGLKTLGRGRSRGLRFSTWRHTYFERLTGAWYDRFGERTEIKNNRLLGTIEKLNQWGQNAEAAFYIHTDLNSDPFRPLGSPCLQYVQFRAYEGMRLDIVGLYRAHDYTNKFLGNAVGLQILGEFVARHTGRTFTGVGIISLHPFCNTKQQLKKLIDVVPV
jgi:hypothetical protein